VPDTKGNSIPFNLNDINSNFSDEFIRVHTGIDGQICLSTDVGEIQLSINNSLSLMISKPS
jgi:hypothetical protein